LCASEAPPEPLSADGAAGVGPDCRCNRTTLGSLLLEVANGENGQQIDAEVWDRAAYLPVPTIIEVAELLYAGHQVADVSHASTNPQNLTITTDRLIEIVSDGHHYKKHVVVFVTGVPGSGA